MRNNESAVAPLWCTMFSTSCACKILTAFSGTNHLVRRCAFRTTSPQFLARSPFGHLFAYAATSEEFEKQVSLFTAFRQSMSLYIDRRWFGLQIVQAEFWFPKGIAVLCVLGIFHSNTTGSAQIRSNSRYSEDRVNHSIFVLSWVSWSWLFMNSAKTKYQIRGNVYLCSRQLDGSVVQQSGSHPWSCIQINCGYPKLFSTSIQDKISLKYRTIVWFSRRPCAWWYANYLDNLVQDVPLPSLSRTWSIRQIVVLTSISGISSPGWRPSFCRTFEWTFSSWPT